MDKQEFEILAKKFFKSLKSLESKPGEISLINDQLNKFERINGIANERVIDWRNSDENNIIWL